MVCRALPDNQECLCIHQIPRPAIPPLQPNQVEIPPEPENMDIRENMDIDILDNISGLIDVP